MPPSPAEASTAVHGERHTTLTIHLLGQPWLERDHEPADGPRGQKAWSLLALLLLAGAAVGRARLAGLLFADADDPLGALRWNLAELRRSLGAGVEIAGDPVSLTLPPGTTVDVATLTSGTWVEAVTVPNLGAALLEGIDTPAAPAFEAWLLTERRRIANLTASVLREAATARLAAGEGEAAVALATRLAAADEFDEDAQALLVQALVAAGRPADARHYLDRTIERIRRELGSEPSAVLLHAAEPAPSPPAAPDHVRGAAAIESLVSAGEAAIGAGVFDAGVEILRRAIVDARAAHEPHIEARAQAAIGTAFVHGGRERDAEGETALHAALALADEVGDHGIMSQAARELGYAEMKRGRYERADAWLERAVSSAPDRDQLSAALAVRGVVASDRGQTVQAVAWLREALADSRELDKPRREGWAATFLGRTYLLREEFDAAREVLMPALDRTRAAGWMAFLAFPQTVLASVDLAEGRVDEASAGFEAAFTLGCQVADPCWEGMAARGIGLVHARQGRPEDSIRWLEDARTRCMRISDSYLWVHAFCQDALCAVAVEHGHASARRWINDLEAVASRTGMQEMVVRAHLHRAALGEIRAGETAALFAARVDNPAVLRQIERSQPPLAGEVAATPAIGGAMRSG